MATTTITPAEIFEKNQVLTLAKAKELMGRKIATTNAEYHMNSTRVTEFTIAEIVSAWDDAARRPYSGNEFNSFQDYWASYMSAEQVDEQKNRLLLMDSDGQQQHVAYVKYYNFYPEPTFHGSDADREVYFVEL